MRKAEEITFDFQNLIVNGKRDWKRASGKQVYYNYKNTQGEIVIKSTDGYRLFCENVTLGNSGYIDVRSLVRGHCAWLVEGVNKVGDKITYKYKNGDIINSNNKKRKIVGVSYRSYNHADVPENEKSWHVYYDVYCFDCKQITSIQKYQLERLTCPICTGHRVVEGYNDIPTTASWMIPFFQNGYEEAKQYTCTSGKRIIPKCPYCGEVHKKSVVINNIYYSDGFKCKCYDGFSYPEKFMMNLLDQINEEYIFQAGKLQLPFDAGLKMYDFYLPRRSCIIETHGVQHYKDIHIYNTNLEEQVKNDNYKYNLAIDGGIKKYYQIDCSRQELEWIKNSIISSGLLDFLSIDKNQIDWKKCSEHGMTNLTKLVCNYYNSHDVQIQELINIFHVGHKGITNYLKFGNDVGWCKYIPFRSSQACNPFEVWKDDTLITSAKSAPDFIKYAKNILGKDFSANQIYKCLSGKIPSYNGFKFKYIEDINIKREVLYDSE